MGNRLLVLVALVGACAAMGWEKPEFCRELECPMFKSAFLRDNKTEIRSYMAGQWAATSVEQSSDSLSFWDQYRMFQNLYKYIEGENMMEAKMEMTTPVLTQVEKIEDGMIRITLLFWMQPSVMVNGSAPAPVNEDVYLVNVPAGRVYVRQFTSLWFKVGYDGPNRWFNRHHEVWLLADPLDVEIV